MFLKSTAQKVRSLYQDTNGEFMVTVGGINLYFIGAPYSVARTIPDRVFKVKMASEQHGAADHVVPVEDFGTPDPQKLADAVERAIEAAFAGRSVFVGCGAGWGRTGLFLAVVLKALLSDYNDQRSIVLKLRQIYIPQAVETEGQKALIDSIDVSHLRRRIKWLWLGAKIRQLKAAFSFTR